MKIARFFAGLFAAMGMALMVVSVGLCFIVRNAQPRIEEMPAEAEQCSVQLMDAIAAGDLTAASRLLYGQPDLGADRAPESSMGIMIWDAYKNSLSYEFQGDCYMEGAVILRDVKLTALDIPSVTEHYQTRVHDLMTQRLSAATELTQIYNDKNEFREELVSAVLYDALVQALREDAKTITWDVRLKLIRKDGSWWAVPDAALRKAISGNMN